ncbi:MAG: hypothetical protein HUJ29_13480 [Gammaproteobacteria bacterium]|nr:hypothetical protein [Gammaproteobacteria bacterium]
MRRFNHKYVLILVVLAALVFLFWPSAEKGPRQSGRVLLPWDLELNESGRVEVMGIEIGQSTLEDARKSLATRSEVALFQDKDDGHLSAEAFFSEVTSGHLSGRIILSLNIDSKQLHAMAERASKRKPMESGNLKMLPNGQDMDVIADSVIQSVTYIPYIDLDDEIIRMRFGEPQEVVSGEFGIKHYLYPQRGLDILLDSNGKEVVQYINPQDFGKLVKPLMSQKE